MSSIADVLAGQARWAVAEANCCDLMPLLPDRCVGVVMGDPPYSEHVHSKQRRMLRGRHGWTSAQQGEVGFVPLGFDALTAEVRRVCGVQFPRVAQRWIIIFTDLEGRDAWQSDLVRAGARHVRVGIWRKPAGQPQLSGDRPAVGCEGVEVAHVRGQRLRWNGGGLPAFWEYAIATDRNGYGDRVHTTQKPLPLMMKLVEQFTDSDEIVLDPFCGGGTTGVAALRLGRRFIGTDIDPRYCAVARERLQAETCGLSLRAARHGQIGLFGGEG